MTARDWCGGGAVLTLKRQKEFSWGGGSVLHLDCSGGYKTMSMCQNSQNYRLKYVYFTVNKLCHNKVERNLERKKRRIDQNSEYSKLLLE